MADGRISRSCPAWRLPDVAHVRRCACWARRMLGVAHAGRGAADGAVKMLAAEPAETGFHPFLRRAFCVKALGWPIRARLAGAKLRLGERVVVACPRAVDAVMPSFSSVTFIVAPFMGLPPFESRVGAQHQGPRDAGLGPDCLLHQHRGQIRRARMNFAAHVLAAEDIHAQTRPEEQARDRPWHPGIRRFKLSPDNVIPAKPGRASLPGPDLTRRAGLVTGRWPGTGRTVWPGPEAGHRCARCGKSWVPKPDTAADRAVSARSGRVAIWKVLHNYRWLARRRIRHRCAGCAAPATGPGGVERHCSRCAALAARLRPLEQGALIGGNRTTLYPGPQGTVTDFHLGTGVGTAGASGPCDQRFGDGGTNLASASPPKSPPQLFPEHPKRRSFGQSADSEGQLAL